MDSKNKRYKDYDELTFQDDFMFWKVMTTHDDVCIGILELILGVKILGIEVTGQASFQLDPHGKGVRLDVLVDDEKGTMYDVEMQTTLQDFLPQRMRYYQGIIDVTHMESGDKYDELAESKVIFICLQDQFKQGRQMYRFRYLDVDHPELELHDKTEKIVLNASADWDDKNPELSAFLQYVQTGIPDSPLSERIDEAVDDVLEHKEWEVEYKVYTAKMYEEYLEGCAEERKRIKNLQTKLSAAMVKNGCSAEDFARVMSDDAFCNEMMQKFGIS